MLKKFIKTILACLISACILTGCSCDHEWVDATCTEAKICTKCDKKEGEPLGHSWNEATCTEPKTCETCKEIEGSSLGHIEGAMKFARTNNIEAVNIYESKCDRCSKVINSKNEKIESFIKEGIFNLTPKELTTRIDNELNNLANCTLVAKTAKNDSGDFGLVIGNSTSNTTAAAFLLSKKNETTISYDEKDNTGFYVALGMVYDDDSLVEVLLSTVLSFDPSLSFEQGKTVSGNVIKNRSYSKNGITYIITGSSGSYMIGVSAK